MQVIQLAFNQSNVTCSRALAGLLCGEFDPLPLAEQLEHCASHRAAVKEVLDAGFIPNESEPFVDQQSCDRARRHTLLREPNLPGAVPESRHTTLVITQ